MKTTSLKNLDLLKVLDGETGAVSYGCEQKWFSTEWRRRAGCGPSVASNIFLYLERAHEGHAGGIMSQKDCAALMEEVWLHVTPSDHGMPTTSMFCAGARSYGESKGWKLNILSLDVPEEKASRPAIGEIAAFLEAALVRNVPAAFLNLCNGDEQNLDRWHWVTVVSVDRPEKEDEPLIVRIIDAGGVKTVDLTLWLATTSLGGGFVYIYKG